MGRPLSGTTRVCALIGAPVARSLSPAMHNAAFARLGLDLAYVALHVEPGRLEEAIAGARALGFVGLNVTAPHKEAALACCAPDDRARAVGAVNTIVLGDGVPRGTNTDTDGLEHALLALEVGHVRRVLVLGAGGAARAAVYVLGRRGADITVAARTARRLRVDGTDHEVRALTDLPGALLAQTDLVVDATPVGQLGGRPLVDVGCLSAGAAVLDLGVGETSALVREATARGLRAHLGHEMLLHQGARAFTLFTGHPAPLDEMRAALRATGAA